MQYLEGILKIANLCLALVAGGFAISLIESSRNKEALKAWIPIIIALVLFVLQEIFGALRAFAIYESAFITHIIPTVILAFLILGLVKQINIHQRK